LTGHLGRGTFVTQCLNAGVDSQLIAEATNHKDPTMILSYHKKNQASKCTGANAIGQMVLKYSFILIFLQFYVLL
jgi:hypothetical protein